MNILDYVGPGCPKCGCTGLHACTGHPMREWTDEEKAHLENVLRDIFKEEETKTNE